MSEPLTFCYTRLTGNERNWQPLYARLCSTALPSLARAGIRQWGAWSGLFGIASNELVLMTSARSRDHAGQLRAQLQSLPCTVGELHLLVPTVRPTGTVPLERPGLYVFRFFDIYNADVDEIAALSQEAWTTFETAANYQAQPQGLFCLQDRSDARGIMLLCTWYDGFESWQASREPPPQARANFQRRHQLTLGTNAFATRLIEAIS
jgi:hypothetical protein